jgi:hypothetical protein
MHSALKKKSTLRIRTGIIRNLRLARSFQEFSMDRQRQLRTAVVIGSKKFLIQESICGHP